MSILGLKPYRRVTTDFAARTRNCRKILAIDIAGLGDLVHALPALWSIRQTYPAAQLHCIANANWAALLQLTPWIDHVWHYSERKKSIQMRDFTMGLQVREQHYDLSINLMGSNRSCITGRVSGAPVRLGRRPSEQDRDGWRWLNTHVMEYPYRTEPRYIQKWKCLRQAGIITDSPRFEIDLNAVAPPDHFAAVAAEAPYIHVSPYTSAPQKELPPEQMGALLTRLHETLPHFRVVLSCAPEARELQALDALLQLMPFRPWRVFAGTLNAAELFAVVRGAVAHLGGDTGSLHLASLAGTPSVSWYWAPGAIREWTPQGDQHRVLTVEPQPVDYLRGLAEDDVIDAVHKLTGGQP